MLVNIYSVNDFIEADTAASAERLSKPNKALEKKICQISSSIEPSHGKQFGLNVFSRATNWLMRRR